MSHSAFFLRRLLPPLWVGVSLVVPGCTDSNADPAEPPLSTEGSKAYGEEFIGYKQQNAKAEGIAEEDDGEFGAAEPTDEEFGGDEVEDSTDEGSTVETEPPLGVAERPDSGPQASTPTTGQTPDASVKDGGTKPDAGTKDAAVSDAAVQAQIDAAVDAAVDLLADAGLDAGAIDAGLDAALDEAFVLAEIPGFDQIPQTERVKENPFRVTSDMAASTFSIDVDTASYTIARAAIRNGALPARQSVRIEEFLNYFHLHYAQPPKGEPLGVYTELAACPWNPDNQLLLLGVQGEEVPLVDQPPANLVFLLDVSGSMNEPTKLPLLKRGFRMMTRQLRAIDTVSIVTYAGNEAVVLQGVSGDDRATIDSALEDLQAGGSTNGEGGIQKAYEIAEEQFIAGGNNRVLLATDGDFNVGLSDADSLADMIATKRETGVFLSVYGFGSPDGYNDPIAENLADKGNGIYFFIDSPEEARRAFIHSFTGSLLTVAKDVKLQLQFNPSQVKGYRLIGYENRVLSNSDFNDDSVDAGELGAGLSVTALVEIIPANSNAAVPTAAAGTDPLEDLERETDVEPGQEQPDPEALQPVTGAALLDVRIRYKGRDAASSELITHRFAAKDISRPTPSLKHLFASGVAEFAMQLRGSQYLSQHRNAELADQLRRALPADAEGAVNEVIELSRSAHSL